VCVWMAMARHCGSADGGAALRIVGLCPGGIKHLRKKEGNGFTSSMALALMQMATLDTAEALMEELRSASWDSAQADLKEVQQFAREAAEPADYELKQWDVGFWAERLR